MWTRGVDGKTIVLQWSRVAARQWWSLGLFASQLFLDSTIWSRVWGFSFPRRCNCSLHFLVTITQMPGYSQAFVIGSTGVQGISYMRSKLEKGISILNGAEACNCVGFSFAFDMLRASFFSLLKGPSRQTALWGCNCFPQRLCHNGVLNSIRCCMTSRSCVSLLRVFVCPMLEAERKSFLYPCVIYWYIYWKFTWIYCVYIYICICIYMYVRT